MIHRILGCLVGLSVLAACDASGRAVSTEGNPPAPPSADPQDPVAPPPVDAFPGDPILENSSCTASEDAVLPAHPSDLRRAPRLRVRTLSMAYYPSTDGHHLDPIETGIDGKTVAGLKHTVKELAAGLCAGREEASRSFRNPEQAPYLDVEFVKHLEYPQALEPGLPYRSAFRPDHEKMFRRDVDICDYVDRQDVREVWVWMYHTAKIEPAESNLSMGRVSSRFFTHDGYGDISNSERSDDLPVCEHSYTVYEFNYGRTVAEALHNYGHHSEALFRWADDELFWNRFVGQEQQGRSRCGWTHFPPNGEEDYDYGNPRTISSDCDQWAPEGGVEQEMDCSAWGCEHEIFMIWWFQHHPGPNNGLRWKGQPLRNWHEFFVDFDLAASLGRSLTEEPG